jgi:hypothetical protein
MPTPEERAARIVGGMGAAVGEAMNLDGKAVGECLNALEDQIRGQIRAAVEAERERCVRKMRERCTYCDDGVVTFTARVPDPRNPYSEEALPEEQQERCRACGEQEAAMREGE